MSKKDNFHDFLADLHEGISTKKPGASRNPQDFRSEIESIVTGGGGTSLAEFDGVCKVTGVPTEEDHVEFLNEYDGKCKVSGVPAEEIPSSTPECSGNHIIEVDTLPTEGIEGATYWDGESYYKYGNKFKDILVVYGGQAQSLVEIIVAFGGVVKLYYVKTRPTENIEISDDTVEGGAIFAIYYVEDEDDILIYGDFEDDGTNEWQSIKTTYGDSYGGTITNASQATTENAVYTLVNIGWTEYRVAPSGTLNITDNGTFDVTNVASVNVNTPSVAVCGIWRFNETVQIGYVDLTQNVNFTTYIEGKLYECTGMWVNASNFSDPTHLDYHGDGVPSVYRGGGDTWLYDSARTVNFGTEPQAVHPDYKSWLTSNATRIDDEGLIKAATELEMDAVLGIAEVGSVVKYTGESTDNYENGGLYIVEAVSE